MFIENSLGGPKLDIIGKSEEPVGYLAEDEDSYTEFSVRAIRNYDDKYH